MIKFKAGDKVRYVTTGPIGWESEDWAESDGLVKGGVYTIRSVNWDDDDPSVTIEQGNCHYLIHPGHFVLVEEGTKEMIKLQPGDYVSTEGMTEDQYHAVCEAFIDAGAGKGDYGCYPFERVKTIVFKPYDEGKELWCSALVKDKMYKPERYLFRELTLSQILNQEENKMDVKEAYKVMQANCGIEVGDTVKVLRKAKDRENGWGTSWMEDMDDCVGYTYTVANDLKEEGFSLKEIGYTFPFFVLELVKKAPKLPESIRISSQYMADFREDGGIVVGCQNIDFETLEKVYLTAKGVKEND